MADVDTTRAGASDDWAVQTADTIERLVESVRSNTSDRLVSATRLVVFGLLAAILGTIGLVLGINALVRFMVSYVGSAWATYYILGGLFTLAGLLLWRQAWKRPAREH